MSDFDRVDHETTQREAAGRALFERECADMLVEAERDDLGWTWDTLLQGTRDTWIDSAAEAAS